MVLLNEVDKPGSDVDEYVNNLDQMLLQKVDIILKMRTQLLEFHKHIKTEECMSKLYQQQQNLNEFELNPNNEEEDEDMLLNMNDDQ
mmetsp:Transcript_20210/g.19152  ORF Transcript_20210/g.19152 Transcript_20210/m.19152 type:complete len:87 (-) Transcript_20210:39-299(-)